eukprot:scaffold111056_cov17-Tisochrysis_lutea.AAC.1
MITLLAKYRVLLFSTSKEALREKQAVPSHASNLSSKRAWTMASSVHALEACRNSGNVCKHPAQSSKEMLVGDPLAESHP